MAMELARVKLRGGYAAFAGAVLLLGIPLVESIILGQPYLSAVARAEAHGTFAPLLVWAEGQGGTDLTFHIVELAPFLLATLFPGVLRRVLWPRATAGGRLVTLCGQVGFALFALAVLLGIPSTRGAASDYAHAASPAEASAVAAGFANAYGFQNLLAHVLGGVLVALFLVGVSARIIRTPVFSRWLGYYGVVPAALLGATALQYLGSLAQVETPLAPVTFAALAFWLLLAGVLTARLNRLPANEPAGTPGTASVPASPSNGETSAAPSRR